MGKFMFKVGEVNKVKVYFHWSLLLYGFFVISRYDDVLKGLISLSLIITVTILHECGHMLVAWIRKHRVYEIVVHILGGYCKTQEYWSEMDEFLISCGGILAQLAIFIIAIIIFPFLSMLGINEDNIFISAMIDVFIGFNLFTIFINLIPVKGLDGEIIWRNILKINIKRKRKANKISQEKAKKEAAKILKNIKKQSNSINKKGD